MNFRVTYRKKDGAIATETIAAADRAACVAECRARGFAPMSVTQGGGRSPSRSQSPAWVKGAIAGVIVVAVAGIAWWWISSRTTTEVPAEKPAKTKVAKPQKPERKPAAKPKQETVKVPEPESAPAASIDFQASYPRTPGHLPLPGGTVITFAPPAPGCTTEVFTVGGLYLCDSEGNFVKYEPPRLFDNRFENTIESLAMNRMLILSPQTKKFSNEDIMKYLSRPITINADDPPDIVERKTATAAMKEEIRGFIKDGGTYAQYVDLLHERIGNERTLHREAMREMVNLLSEGDVEGARMYRQQINNFLSENGYLGLKLPDEWQRQLDGKPESNDGDNDNDSGAVNGN